MSEDEALRRAIAASLSDQPQSASAAQPQRTQDHTHQPNCDEDEALARAIAGNHSLYNKNVVHLQCNYISNLERLYVTFTAASLNEEPPKPKSKPVRHLLVGVA